MLDDELPRLSPEDRARAEALAHRWLGDKVDAPAPAGQPTSPQTQAAPFRAPAVPRQRRPARPPSSAEMKP